MEKRMTKGYRDMMKFQISRARRYYKRARRGVRMLAPESRVPVQASLDCYSMILDKIEENDYDNFGLRAYVSKEEKVRMDGIRLIAVTTSLSMIYASDTFTPKPRPKLPPRNNSNPRHPSLVADDDPAP